MLSINTNLSSLIAQSSMKSSTQLLNQAVERMTTGYKINHAKDNAANYSISTNMNTQLSAYDVAADNVAMGMDLVTTASDIISQMQDKASRLHALSTQARNGTYGAQSLDAINSEASAIMAEINRLYNTAEYNGVALFKPKTTTAEATPTVVTFALTRSATSEGNFIEDPITYTDEEVAAMTPLTDAITTVSSGQKYSISSVDELENLAELVNSGVDTTGVEFVLGADIDLADYGNWTPIGDSSNDFKGTFDGNGHVIKNLTIDNETQDYQGLFGRTASGSEIKNIGLVGGSVKGKQCVGGLVGDSYSSSIDNCYATCDVTGLSEYVGGLVGNSYASITRCYATGDVTGSSAYVGGLVGNSYASITRCYATGDVTGDFEVGGLVGFQRFDIINSYAMGAVSGTSSVGGLVGGGIMESKANIENCYATGDVSGTSYVGGLVGENYEGTFIITRCYALGNVTGDSKVGGLVGFVEDTGITNSYAMGTVSGTSNVGGLVGSNGMGAIVNSYATSTVTGSSSVGGLVGYSRISNLSNCASVQTDSKATVMTEEEIKTIYTPESMGFTEENGWTIVDGTPLQSWQEEAQSATPTPDPDPTPVPDPDPDEDNGSSGGGSYGVANFFLQIGIHGNSSSQISFDTNFSYDLSVVEADIASEEALSCINDFLILLSEKSTLLGAVQNRLESALDSIEVNINNLTSSLSTIRDADMAELSSTYIQQQILQQASAILLATANQSPSIALQLI